MNDLAKRLRTWAETTFGLSYKDELELYLAEGAVERKVEPRLKTWFTDFWNDPAKFVGACRFVIVGLSGAILSGQIVLPWPKVSWFLAVFLPAIAVGVPAGSANPSPGQIKLMAQSPDVQVTPKDERVASAAIKSAE